MLYDQIVSRVLVDKGWSADKKYKVQTENGEQFLLRISPAEKKDSVSRSYLMMQKAGRLPISMCHALEWGTCEDGVYFLQNWIEGRDAEEVIPSLSSDVQYSYGLSAGRDLRTLHSLPAPPDTVPWEIHYGKKIDRKLRMYAASPLKYEDDACMLSYIAENRHLIADRPLSYQHGDHHIGNMMISKSGEIVLIDFEKDDFGDPWEEFNRIVWSAQASPYFASGIVDGYFDWDVPEHFWRLLALYICTNTLGSLPWAIPFGEKEILVMREQQKQVLQWYDDFKCIIPNWYHPSGKQVITLREIHPQDQEAVNALLLDSRVAETYMIPEGINEELARKYFTRFLEISRRNDRYFRVICADGKPVGIIHDTEIQDKTVELGWAILSEYQGRGIGTDAVRLALDEMKHWGFADVIAGAFSDNIPSIRVMQKNGMIALEQKETISYRGKDHLCIYYSVKL